MDPKTTGQFISRLRKEQGLTQKQMAERLNVSDKAVSRWETGKGYPDIETLSALSNEFGVSINELLIGKRNAEKNDNADNERQLANAYVTTVNNNKRVIRILVTIFVLLALTLVLIVAIISGIALYNDMLACDECIISLDRQTITLFGRKYVPFDVSADGLSVEFYIGPCITCDDDTRIIREAQIEGLGKFNLFEESIYSVSGCTTLDIIRYSGGGDVDYYCALDVLDKYTDLLKSVPFDTYTAQISAHDGYYEFALDESIVAELSRYNESNYVSDINCQYCMSDGDQVINIHTHQADSPFYKNVGQLLKKDGGYYWFDYRDIPDGQDDSDYSRINAHYISAENYGKVESLFDMLGK